MRALVVVATVVCSTACGARTGPFDEGPCECLTRHERPILSVDQIVAIQEQAIDSCFTQVSESDDEGVTLWHEAGECLPRIMGRDERNGLEVEVFYFCSDLCPVSGWVGLHYVDVTEPDCCALGGTPMFDVAWGGYLGCSPPPLGRGRECGWP